MIHAAAGLALLGVLSWLLLALLTPQLRRLFPAIFLGIAAAGLAATAGVLLLWNLRPGALLPLAAAALVSATAATVFFRDGYGRARGLPPGSLSPVTSLRALVDRDFYRSEAVRLGPVFKMAQFHQPVVCVVGLTRAQALLQQHDESLGPSPQPLATGVSGGFLRYMRDDMHGVYGPLFRQALSGRVVASAVPAVHAATRAAADAALAESALVNAGSDGTHLQADTLVERVADHAFLRALFGISAGSAADAAFAQAYAPLRRRPLSRQPTQATTAAMATLRAHLAETVAAWRANPSEAPVCALSELMRIDPAMPDAVCIDNLVFIHRVSASNAAGLLRWLLATLGTHPWWIARLRDSFRDDNDSPPLVDRVIMETLRLSQSEYLYRRLRTDLRFDGFVLPKGWLLRLCIRESHLSAEVFEQPDAFNPDRFLGRDVPRTAYMPFGGDRHACNGVPLTNVISRAFLETLTMHYDWSLDGVVGLERELRHWSHWRPSRRMAVRLRRCDQRPSATSSASVSNQGSSPDSRR